MSQDFLQNVQLKRKYDEANLPLSPSSSLYKVFFFDVESSPMVFADEFFNAQLVNSDTLNV